MQKCKRMHQNASKWKRSKTAKKNFKLKSVTNAMNENYEKLPNNPKDSKS